MKLRAVTLAATLVAIVSLTRLSWPGVELGSSEQDRTEIRRVLNDQIDAWNHGNIDGFMDGYWKSPDLIYQGNSKTVKGWDTLRDFYHKTFAPPNNSLGILSLTSVEMSAAGKNVVVVWGRYEVITQDGKRRGGLYTLVMHKFRDGWKTIYDRTSSEK